MRVRDFIVLPLLLVGCMASSLKMADKMSKEYVLGYFLQLDTDQDNIVDCWALVYEDKSKNVLTVFYALPYGTLQTITLDDGVVIKLWRPNMKKFRTLSPEESIQWRIPQYKLLIPSKQKDVVI